MEIQEALIRWNDFECSEFRNNMLTGINYFNAKNEITEKDKGRYATSLDEKNQEYKTLTQLSDRRIANNFFKFIINQQVAYGIARNFILTTNEVEELEKKIDIKSIKSKLFKFFGIKGKKERFKEFNILVSKTFSENYAEFVEACKNGPKEQIGWLYIYYNDNGQLEFMSMKPEELCPVWGNEKKTYIDEMIRKYKVTEYSTEGSKEVEYIEIYDLNSIRKYRFASETAEEPELVEERAYYINSDGTNGTFPKLPFIPIKYNADMTSLLQDIKPQVDAYDKIISEVANNIIDIPNSLIMVNNFDGTNADEVDKFVNNLKRTRILFAPENADAKSLQANQNIVEIDTALTRLRKDIFELGGGVDTQNKDLKDTSGVALRWSYSNLEEKFNVWSNQLNIAIKQIIDFILWDNVAQGGSDYSDIDYNIVYDTDSIINESETIQNLQLSKGLIGPETIAANHPYTKDTAKEVTEMKEQMIFAATLGEKEPTDKDGDQQTNEQLIEKTVK